MATERQRSVGMVTPVSGFERTENSLHLQQVIVYLAGKAGDLGNGLVSVF